MPCASSAGWDAGQWTQWAPHHPQCRCWQVLVPSDAAHPPVHFDALPPSAAGIPFSSGLLSPLPLSYIYFPASLLLLHRALFLLPAPPPRQRPSFSSQLASRQPRASTSHLRLLCPVAASRRNRQFQRQIRHLDDKPSQACRHPNLIGTDATDSLPNQFDERKKGPPLPCQPRSPAAVRLSSAFSSIVVSSPIDNRPPACTCHCFAANSSFGASALVHSARPRHTVPVSAALDKLVHQYLDRVTGR